jgi:hypothetical protein
VNSTISNKNNREVILDFVRENKPEINKYIRLWKHRGNLRDKHFVKLRNIIEYRNKRLKLESEMD